MPLQKLQFLPGFFRRGTSYSDAGRWFEGQWVRFRDKYPEKMGGWQQYSSNTFGGICRRLRQFASLAGITYTAVGTSTKMYVESGGTFTDITPVRATSAGLTNPFDSAAGSSVITVTDSTHGAQVGDVIIVSGATGFDDITAGELNIEATITSTADANTFTYVCNGTGTSGLSTQGGTVTITYLITPGSFGYPIGAGWGALTFDSALVTRHWGDPADLSAAYGQGKITQWTAEPYGEDLIFHPRYGSMYYWDQTSPTARGALFSTLGGHADAPTTVIKTIVSPKSRHVITFGCNTEGAGNFDPMYVRWSDNESVANFTASTTNTAGSQRLTRGSTIITAIPTRELILIYTDTSLYAMQWIGGQYVFSIDLIAEHSSIIGFNAAAIEHDTVYWLGYDGFHSYDGSVTNIDCEVEDYILNDIDYEYADKVSAGKTTSFDEVIWLYVSTSSADGEPDKYVIYNTRIKAWYYGSIARTVWYDNQYTNQPLAAGTDGYLYSHEVGFDDGSTNPPQAITSYVESLPFELGNGDKFSFITRIIHDITFRLRDASTSSAQKATITLKASDYPGEAIQDTDSGTITRTNQMDVEEYTRYTDLRLRGRQCKVRCESTTLGSSWRLGTPRLEMREDGRK